MRSRAASPIDRALWTPSARRRTWAGRGVVATSTLPLLMWFGRVQDAATVEDRWSAVAGLAGLAGQWSLLVLVVVMSHTPAVSRVLDQREVIELHMRLGSAAVALVAVHVWINWLVDRDVLTGRLPSSAYLCAAAAAVLLVLTTVSTAPYVVHLVRFERWFAVHRMVLLAVVLSLWHEWEAASVSSSPTLRALWIAMHVLVLAWYTGWRVVRPRYVSRRRRLRVRRSEPVAPGMQLVTIDGRDLDALRPVGARALGFAWVRFLVAGDHWGDWHPVTVTRVRSGTPDRTTSLQVLVRLESPRDPNHLRGLEEGDLVQLDGFHGQMTAVSRRSDRVVVFASGSAVETVLPLLLDLRDQSVDTIAVLRLSSWGHELSSFAQSTLRALARTGVQVVVLPGPSYRTWFGRRTWLGAGRGTPPVSLAGSVQYVWPRMTAGGREPLAVLLQDLLGRDAYVVGARGWSRRVVRMLRRLGVSVHREYVAWDRRHAGSTARGVTAEGGALPADQTSTSSEASDRVHGER